MRHWLRYWLCCVLCLSLPVQAAAHAALRDCQVGSPPASAMALADGHAAVHGGGHVSVIDATHGGRHGEAATIAIHDHGPSDAGCVQCAACGVATALPASGAGLAAPVSASGGWSASASSRVARVGIRGPERPPRTRAA